jgi:hypothetical protein
METPLSQPVNGSVYLTTPTLNEHSRARRDPSDAHAQGRKVVGRGIHDPILVQRVDFMPDGSIVKSPLGDSGVDGVTRETTPTRPDRFGPLVPVPVVAQVAPVQAPVPSRPAHRVMFTGKRMPRVTIPCDEVVVNERVIAIGFAVGSGRGAIEPPQAGVKDGMLVIIDNGDPVPVLSHDWSFESNGMLWVILIPIA